jgi:hypothetical protein
MLAMHDMKNEHFKFSLKGLLPFDEDDAAMYHISETVIEDFFRNLKKNKFVFLTGDPASGKTSFLNCIVLKQASIFFNNGRLEWETIKFRPGLEPVKNLAQVLAKINVNNKQQNVASKIEALLKNGSNGMIEAFKHYPLQQNKCLLLVIDNLEDIFFLRDFHDNTIKSSTSPTSVQAFINLLWTFEKLSDIPVYIVVSFSNLFRERVPEYPKLLELLQKNEFRFEGVAISDLEKIIDKIIPLSLKDCQDFVQLKHYLQTKFHADQENDMVDPSWRLVVHHVIKRTMVIWNRGYRYVREEMSSKSILKEVERNKYLPCLINELIRNEGKSNTSILHRKAEELWNLLSQEHQQTLKHIIKSSRAKGKVNTILECYKLSGGIEHSIEYEAKELFSAAEENEKMAASIIRTLISKGALPRPLKYETIVEQLKTIGKFEEEKIRRFVNHFGNSEFGFIQTISSSRIEEGLNTIEDAGHIDDDAIVAVRNISLLRKDSFFDHWAKREHECISEYLMYAQMANTDSETYPITLQLYANTILTGAPIEQCKHSSIIHEFLQKNRAWAALHTNNDKQFADFEKTKKFIAKGITHWHQIKKAEDNRKLEEKRIRKLKRSLVIFIFIIISVFTVRTYMSVEKHKMLKQLDCLYDDHLRIVGVITFKYVENLENGRPPEPKVNEWLNALLKQTTAVDEVVDSLHTAGILTFISSHTRWERERDKLLNDHTRRDILQSALDKKFLTPKGGVIIAVEGYQLFNDSPLPKDSLYVVDCSRCEEPNTFIVDL